MIDAATALAFSLYENKGVYALLLGSGVSRGAQIPTGWEVTLDLVKRIGTLRGVKGQTDWAAWHFAEFGTSPDYSKLLDQLAQSADERRAVLHSYIEPTPDDVAEGRKLPTAAHHAIARLVQAGFVRIIITTNFDRLIENALKEAGVEPTIISSDDDLTGAVPLIHSRCYLVKVHGDYLDTRVLNTEAELESYSPRLNALLDRIIDEHGLIVCGWSADWDPGLRSAIQRAPNRRYPLFWASRGRPSAVAQDLIDRRGGRMVTIDGAEAFFDDLERKVSLQIELKRENPQSVELSVATAKKYVARSEYRVQLDDLIGTKMRELGGALLNSDFNADGQFSSDRFGMITERYEAVSEPLCKIFGILGRYGDEGELKSAVTAIVVLAARPEIGGLVILLALRSYPALLLFYFYGLNLLNAGRYRTLYRLFTARLDESNGMPPKVLVERLFLGTWRGAEDEDIWKSLPGMGRKRTPLSDHLHDLFQVWGAELVFSPTEFTRLFEEFELLGALAYLSGTTELSVLRQSKTPDKHGRDYVWAPLGRIFWDSENRRVILSNLHRAEKTAALLDAGFGNGDKEFLNEALGSLDRQSARFSIYG